jgi:hypothetical protein
MRLLGHRKSVDQHVASVIWAFRDLDGTDLVTDRATDPDINLLVGMLPPRRRRVLGVAYGGVAEGWINCYRVVAFEKQIGTHVVRYWLRSCLTICEGAGVRGFHEGLGGFVAESMLINANVAKYLEDVDDVLMAVVATITCALHEVASQCLIRSAAATSSQAHQPTRRLRTWDGSSCPYQPLASLLGSAWSYSSVVDPLSRCSQLPSPPAYSAVAHLRRQQLAPPAINQPTQRCLASLQIFFYISASGPNLRRMSPQVCRTVFAAFTL